MKISKSDAIFLCKVLHHYGFLVSDSVTSSTSGLLDDLSYRLENFILNNSSDIEEVEDDEVEEVDDLDEDDVEVSESEDDEVEEDDNDEEDLQVDEEIDSSKVVSLPSINVVTEHGEKFSLKFESCEETEEDEDPHQIDLVLNDGDVIIENVQFLRISDSILYVFASEDWHTFSFKKLTRTWTNVLENDKVYEVVQG